MADQTLDARRAFRDQESRIAATASIGLATMKPFMEFQTSMLRLGVEYFDLLVRNVEKNVEAFNSIVEGPASTATYSSQQQG